MNCIQIPQSRTHLRTRFVVEIIQELGNKITILFILDHTYIIK
jgi:hypothetical protein